MHVVQMPAKSAYFALEEGTAGKHDCFYAEADIELSAAALYSSHC